MRRVTISLIICILLLSLPLIVNAQVNPDELEWDVYGSEYYGIQFEIPTDDWIVESDDDDEDMSILSANDVDETIFLIVKVFEMEDIDTKELFDIAVEDLGVELENDSWEEDLNGLDAWIGLGIGVIEAESDDEEDLDIFVWILSASQDDKRYVAYLFCALEDAEYYEDLMIYIMASFMPYQEEDE